MTTTMTMIATMMTKMKMNKQLRITARCVALAALLLFIVPCARAGNHKPKPYALISGTVWAPNNQPVPGVRVMIRPATQKKTKWKVITNREGEFDQRVPAGDAEYIVWCEPVSAPQGGNVTAQPVTVHVYDQEREDTGLHLK